MDSEEVVLRFLLLDSAAFWRIPWRTPAQRCLKALAVDEGFPIECKQRGAEFRIKSLIQTRPPVHQQYSVRC